mgnify:CR=1 FL=1
MLRQAQQQTLLKRVPHQLKAPRQTRWAKARRNLNDGQAEQIEGSGVHGDATDQGAHRLPTALHIRICNGGQA